MYHFKLLNAVNFVNLYELFYVLPGYCRSECAVSVVDNKKVVSAVQLSADRTLSRSLH